MAKLRLRTKFLLSTALISFSLTAITLLLVRNSVNSQVRKGIFTDLDHSLVMFRNFQQQRAATLSQATELLADLPVLRALMTTTDELTIQDASQDLWQVAPSDLFVLADRSGKVVALHTSMAGFTREMAQQRLPTVAQRTGQADWWIGGGRIYEVFVKPIYLGSPTDSPLLGFLAVGYEIDEPVVKQMGQLAGGQIVFAYGDTIVRSTLPQEQQNQFLAKSGEVSTGESEPARQIELEGERFLARSFTLAPGRTPVTLTVLKSYDKATAFLNRLNRLLVGLGLLALASGSALVFWVSHSFTRPLENLVAGVRALEEGDFSYHLQVRGKDEVADLTRAFDKMRHALEKNREQLLEAERQATIGRMASSISHDLRHSLAAVLANTEFLCEPGLTSEQREELYREVRVGVDRMNELIESLLEFSRTRESLRLSFGSVNEAIDRAVQGVRLHPEFHQIAIEVFDDNRKAGWLDLKRVERALLNVVLNACEAVPPAGGRIDVRSKETSHGVEITVADNGSGVPENVRDSLFKPFVSFGKENGTGLGLAIAQKIIQDHGGDIVLVKTSSEGSTFKLTLPLAGLADSGAASDTHAKPKPVAG